MRASRTGFVVPLESVRHRADPKYALGTERFNRRFAAPKYPLVQLRDLAVTVQYGTSARCTDAGSVPVLRMVNLQEDGWDLSSLKYFDPSPAEVERYRLIPGDILFNRTNSTHLVGKSAVFGAEGTWLFASYLIRLRVDAARVRPRFVSSFLNGEAGRLQINRVSRPIIGMTNVNSRELLDLWIPLPTLAEQDSLLEPLERARQMRDERLERAARQLDSFDEWANGAFFKGALAPPTERQRSFAVSLSSLVGGRIDPPAYTSSSIEHAAELGLRRLGDLTQVDPPKVPVRLREDGSVPYVGLPQCSQTRIEEIVYRAEEGVKGRKTFRTDDILFARIEPSVFNKKYVYVDDLRGLASAYTSTEFYVIRSGNARLRRFLYGMLFTDFVHSQVRGKTKGSSGRRRLDRGLLEAVLVPVPSEEVQEAIGAGLTERLRVARSLQKEAGQTWRRAKEGFEAALLGSPE